MIAQQSIPVKKASLDFFTLTFKFNPSVLYERQYK